MHKSDSPKLSRNLWIIFLFSFFPVTISANPPGELSRNQWVVAVQSGTAMILTEFTPDLRTLKNEFDHQPGLALDFSLSRTMGSHWEPGINLSINHFNGKSALPEFSANGYHYRFKDLYQLPVQYQTASYSLYIFMRYYFRNYPTKRAEKIRIDPFAEFGIGGNNFKTEISYQQVPPGETSAKIFVKGQGINPLPGSSAQYTLGTGARMNFKKDWNLLLSFNLDMVNSDCMDAVHNYDPQGNSNHAKTILGRLKVGVIIPITNPLKTTHQYLPWAPNQ